MLDGDDVNAALSWHFAIHDRVLAVCVAAVVNSRSALLRLRRMQFAFPVRTGAGELSSRPLMAASLPGQQSRPNVEETTGPPRHDTSTTELNPGDDHAYHRQA